MATTIEHISQTKKACTTNHSVELLKQQYNKKFKEVKKTAVINGFRPGKVKDLVIEKKFGPSIKEEIIHEVLQETWTNILKEHSLEPLSYPAIEIDPKDAVVNLDFNHDLVIKYTFEVEPEINVLPVEELGLSFIETAFDANQIALYERYLARNVAEQKDKEGVAQEGDLVSFDASFTVDGVVSEEKGLSLFLDSEESNQDFIKNLIGMKAGEEKSFSYLGVANAFNKMKEGDLADVTVKVIEVKELELPTRDQLKEKLGFNQEDSTEQGFDEYLEVKAREAHEQKDFNHNKGVFLQKLLEVYDFSIPELYLNQIQENSHPDKEKQIEKMKKDMILNRYTKHFQASVNQSALIESLTNFSLQSNIPIQHIIKAMNQDKEFNHFMMNTLLVDDLVKKVVAKVLHPESFTLELDNQQKAITHDHHDHHHHGHVHGEHCNHDHH
jgi:trigger factor